MPARADENEPDPVRAPLLAGERVALRVQRYELRRQDVHPKDAAKRGSPGAEPSRGIARCERLAERLRRHPRGRNAVGGYVAAVYGTVVRARAAGRLDLLARLVGLRGGATAALPAVIAALIRATCPWLEDDRVAEFTGAARWLLFHGCLPSDARPILVRDGVGKPCAELVAELAERPPEITIAARACARARRTATPVPRKPGGAATKRPRAKA